MLGFEFPLSPALYTSHEFQVSKSIEFRVSSVSGYSLLRPEFQVSIFFAQTIVEFQVSTHWNLFPISFSWVQVRPTEFVRTSAQTDLASFDNSPIVKIINLKIFSTLGDKLCRKLRHDALFSNQFQLDISDVRSESHTETFYRVLIDDMLGMENASTFS